MPYRSATISTAKLLLALGFTKGTAEHNESRIMKGRFNKNN